MEGAGLFCQLMVAKAKFYSLWKRQHPRIRATVVIQMVVFVSNDTHLLRIKNNCLPESTEKLI